MLRSPHSIRTACRRNPAQLGTREVLARHIRAESTTWGKLIRDRQITGP